MAQEIKCDRCNRPISTHDERVLIILKQDYPGQDICVDCDLEITLAASCAAQDVKKRRKPGTTARMMLERYESK